MHRNWWSIACPTCGIVHPGADGNDGRAFFNDSSPTVSRQVRRNVKEKDGGELGEYLRLRERDRVEGEWALERLLEEPAARLGEYLELFHVRLHSHDGAVVYVAHGGLCL